MKLLALGLALAAFVGLSLSRADYSQTIPATPRPAPHDDARVQTGAPLDRPPCRQPSADVRQVGAPLTRWSPCRERDIPTADAQPSTWPTRGPVLPDALLEELRHRHRIVSGLASTYGDGWDGWIALPEGKGVAVRVCGSGGCANVTSTDAGPDLAMQRRGRIVDLDVPTFELVCGTSDWRSLGLCRVTVEYR